MLDNAETIRRRYYIHKEPLDQMHFLIFASHGLWLAGKSSIAESDLSTTLHSNPPTVYKSQPTVYESQSTVYESHQHNRWRTIRFKEQPRSCALLSGTCMTDMTEPDQQTILTWNMQQAFKGRYLRCHPRARIEGQQCHQMSRIRMTRLSMFAKYHLIQLLSLTTLDLSCRG